MVKKYRSNAERRVAEWLTKQKINFEYEATKFKYLSRVKNGICDKCQNKKVSQQRTYTPDFYFKDYGFYIECKGKLDPSTRSKLLDIIRCNPGLRLYLHLFKDNKLRKNSDKRYSHWCIDNNIYFAVGDYPPLRWFVSHE